MALTYSYLHASQGSDVVFTIALVNSNGSKLNLTGYTVRGKYARSHSSATKYSFAAQVKTPAANGEITLTLTNAATDAIKPGNYVYDVETVDAEDKVERVLEGLLEISASVTTT
jgi:hypothetical protein